VLLSSNSRNPLTIVYPLLAIDYGLDIQLAGLYAEVRDWSPAHQTTSTTVSLFASLTPRFLSRSYMQYLLIEVTGLASDAAAIALISENSPYGAVQLLELSRGVIITSLSEMRADISDLQRQHAKLAEEYLRLRDQLDASTAAIRPAEERIASLADLRYNAAQKL
jgi:hypothetical protein